MADGLDTGIFVMGRERGLALIERLPGLVQSSLIVMETFGSRHISKNESDSWEARIAPMRPCLTVAAHH